VRFSWDARKSARNLRERGFDFEFATQIFDGSTLERTDSRRDYGERRVIALGKAQGIALAVVYTDRAESNGEVNRRIISARKSNHREREPYKKATNASSEAVRGRADLARLRRVSEREIKATSPPELADLPDDFWDDATVVEPSAKQPISLRVDTDVLRWFKTQGPRYQSRINAVLRSYMTQRRQSSRRKTG
jgi:uncharacterized DUF497 family protein